MSLRRWERLRLARETKNPWWTYRVEEYKLPSGNRGEYHYVHTNESSMAIHVLDDGRVILVRQYRYLCDRDSLEFPCGSVKDGSTYEQTARLELSEEAGLQASELLLVGEFNPYNGVTDEMCRVYITRGFTPSAAIPDATGEFEHVYLHPPEIDAALERGEIWDGMTIAAWLLGRTKITP
jgi:ADP-ribose pyrophosphatase